ncbi:hypothetical protein BDV33DRAFT_210388 [Aspergillus novoparasiticus]|uniref:Uncharacterized protein n=1 Tax=Aspergillus novoparasiticus TaxID=986946 RepID=A0A5N6E6Q9_9EURO|nr:hypothetical protein BDV33DRAFT_210388 [Aspergillus novoparasiticus]
MPQDTQQPTECKESYFEKIIEHHSLKNGNGHQVRKDKSHGVEGELHSDLKKCEAACKRYLKRDKQLEEEGQTYGGLM